MHVYQILFVLIGMSYLIADTEEADHALFQEIGTYTQGKIEKTLWVPRKLKLQWYLTRPLCLANGFDILTISTLDEFDSVADICEENKNLFGWYVHIGGMSRRRRLSRTNWYWVTNNETISYEMPWRNGQPDNYGNNEYCLSLTRNAGFAFNDIPCEGSWAEKFICVSMRQLEENTKD